MNSLVDLFDLKHLQFLMSQKLLKFFK